MKSILAFSRRNGGMRGYWLFFREQVYLEKK